MGGLTGLRPEGCGRLPAAGCVEGLCRKVVVAAPPQITKKGHGFAVGCVKGLCKKVQRFDRPVGRRVLKFDRPFGPEGCGGGCAAN